MTAPPSTPRTESTDPSPIASPRPLPLPTAAVAAAILFGAVCGAFEITNTSIGWHLASGRWMIEHGRVLDHDVFSFTAAGAEWIDHEWLFQLLVAVFFDIGGAPALVALRMAVIAALALLLLRIGVTSGLDPPAALVLSVLCVLAARPRFFLRPELATLLLLPLAMWLFARRDRMRWWPLPLAAVIAVGANLHGGILVAPVLIAVWWAGEVLDLAVRRRFDRSIVLSGAVGVAAAALAPLLNPHGWRIWTVPFRLAEMVRMPHIPNPEWRVTGPSDVPALYLALALAVVALAVGRGLPRQWLTVAAAATLAIRHVRNIGLFFVLLPQTVAPALAHAPWLAAGADRRRLRWAASLLLVGLLGIAAVARPWPRAGFGFADRWYPDRAWSFLTEHGLLDGRLYNDVRFGGWLILRGYPETRVFLDDRNEIHEPLLREIWRILSSSDVAGWQALLDRWGIDTVLLRYHEPVRVTTPAGDDLGRRGFSTLWFDPARWAMVYWDDVAMVLVRRGSVPEALLAAREYRVLRPDDLEHLSIELRSDPALAATAEAELERALADDPGCRLARGFADWLEREIDPQWNRTPSTASEEHGSGTIR